MTPINRSAIEDKLFRLNENTKFIDDTLKEQAEMAKFRNMLVHYYDSLDDKKVLEYSCFATEIFQIFGKSSADFLQAK